MSGKRVLLEGFCLAAVAGSAAAVAVVYGWLPATIPTEFGLDGKPVAYGSKATLWLMPAVAAGVYALLTAVSALPSRFYNYPVTVTAANRDTLATLAQGLLLWLKVLTVAMFATMSALVLRSAFAPVPPGAFFSSFLFVGLIGVCVVRFLLRMAAVR